MEKALLLKAVPPLMGYTYFQNDTKAEREQKRSWKLCAWRSVVRWYARVLPNFLINIPLSVVFHMPQYFHVFSSNLLA